MTAKPVLVTVWNRPDSFNKVLAAVAAYGPGALYIFSDGTVPKSPHSLALVTEVRSQITKFRWRCPVRRLELEQNSGARAAFLRAISWFFENESEGIIIQDDCVPAPAFFGFCELLLERFREDMSVNQIGGLDASKSLLSRSGHRVSEYQHVEAFATWRSRWEGFVPFCSGKSLASSNLENLSGQKRMTRIWQKRIAKELGGLDDNWDSSWNVWARINRRRAVVPLQNLVENIGMAPGALHADKAPLLAGMPAVAKTHLPVERILEFCLPEETSQKVDKYVSRVLWRCQPIGLQVLLALPELLRRKLSPNKTRTAPLRRISQSSDYYTVNELFWRGVFRFGQRMTRNRYRTRQGR